MSTNNYAQLCPISFVGQKELQVSKIDFETCCPCQITACDGGIINVCAKIKFKEGFIFDGDICDIDGGATFYEFTSLNGYYLEHSTSTCEEPVAKTQAITYFTDTTGTDGTVLSTVFDNYAGTPGNAYILINSCLDQPLVNPPTDPLGMAIIGGALDRTKNVRIQTDQSTSDAILTLRANGPNGQIKAKSDGKIDLTSVSSDIILETLEGKIDGRASGDIDFTTTNGEIHLDATAHTNGEIDLLATKEIYLSVSDPSTGAVETRSETFRARGLFSGATQSTSAFQISGNENEVILGPPDPGEEVSGVPSINPVYNPDGGKNLYLCGIWFNKGYFGDGRKTGPIGMGMRGTGQVGISTPSTIDASILFEPFSFDRSVDARNILLSSSFGSLNNKWSYGYFTNHYVTSQHHEIGTPGDGRIPSSSQGTAGTPTEIGRHVFGNDSGTYYNYLCIDTFDASNPTKTCWVRSPAFTTF